MLVTSISLFVTDVFTSMLPKHHLTPSQTTNSRPFQTKMFADDYFKHEENSRGFSKAVENNVGKGKLLVMSNFSFLQCFQRTCTIDT